MEFLKDVLGEELYSKVLESLKDKDIKLVNINEGNYIDKKIYESAVEERDGYKTQLDLVDGKLQTLNSQLSGQENLQATVQSLQTEIENKNNLLNETTKNYKIKDAIRGFNVKDPDDIFFRLNLEKIKEDNGKLMGLDEQVLPLKESKSYLFNDEKPPKAGNHIQFGGEQDKPTMNDLIRGRR